MHGVRVDDGLLTRKDGVYWRTGGWVDVMSTQVEREQRVAAYGLAEDGARVLLVHVRRGPHAGRWTLPGGGVDHGERPSVALAREVEEECGLPCEVTDLLGVHDTHFFGNAPSGRIEDYHGIHLIFGAVVGDGEPRVLEVDGTTDAVAWVPIADIESGAVDVLDVVHHALGRVS